MWLKIHQPLLASNSCDLLIEAIDVLLPRNPILTAEGLQLPMFRIQFSQSSMGTVVKPNSILLRDSEFEAAAPSRTATRPIGIAQTRDPSLWIGIGHDRCAVCNRII